MTDCIWLHGSAFGENFGDVLLLDLYKANVEDRGFDAAFPFGWPGTLSRLRASRGLMRRPKRLLFCGGGYFGEPAVGQRSWARRFRVRHYPAIFSAGTLCRAAPMALGIGFGPISDRRVRRTVVNLLSDCEVCLFRDEQSLALFLQYGGTRSPSVDLSADMVLNLNGRVFEKPSDFPITAKEVWVFHLANEFGEGRSFSDVYNAALKFAVDSRDKALVLIVADGRGRAGRKTGQDRLASRLAADLKEKGVDHSIKRYVSHWDLVATIAHASFVVTTKLHVGIVSATLGTRVCAIPYHPKTSRFYSQIGEERRCLSSFNDGTEVYRHLAGCAYEFGNPVIPSGVRAMAERNLVELARL